MNDKVNPHFIQSKQKYYEALWSISFLKNYFSLHIHVSFEIQCM